MDLDQAKLINSDNSAWPRVGMLICFAIAAGMLVVSIWMPTAARAIGHGLSPL
jgi:hypothetical protein